MMRQTRVTLSVVCVGLSFSLLTAQAQQPTPDEPSCPATAFEGAPFRIKVTKDKAPFGAQSLWKLTKSSNLKVCAAVLSKKFEVAVHIETSKKKHALILFGRTADELQKVSDLFFNPENKDPNALLAETLGPAGTDDGSGSSLRAGQSTGVADTDNLEWVTVVVVDIERENFPGVQFLAKRTTGELVEIQTQAEDAWYLLPGDRIDIQTHKSNADEKPESDLPREPEDAEEAEIPVLKALGVRIHSSSTN